jgi:hypothetical protein
MSCPIAPYRLRTATADDVAVIARHRVAMFRDMGLVPAADDAPLEAGSARFLARALPASDYFGWLAELDGTVVAGAGIVAAAAAASRVSRQRHRSTCSAYTDPPTVAAAWRALMHAVLTGAACRAAARRAAPRTTAACSSRCASPPPTMQLTLTP